MQPETKKRRRIERKKKKLAALINITELNNKDRVELESPQPYGPGGDHKVTNTSDLECADTIDMERNKANDLNDSVVSENSALELDLGEDSSLNQCELSAPSDEANISRRKHKKKRKSKHQEEHSENDTVRKRKSKCEIHEDWPELVPAQDSKHKRKSSFEMEIQKERPYKMVKRHTDHCTYNEAMSFTDELMSFKRDLKRNKKKHEKIQRREKSEKDGEKSTEKNTDDESSNERKDTKAGEDINDRLGQGLPVKIDNADDLTELHRLLRERKQQLKVIPMVRLKGVGKEADLELMGQRTPILACEVQNLILLSQLGCDTPRYPKWIELKKFNRLSKTVVLVVEGASAYDFLSCESSCPTLNKMEVRAEMISPYSYRSSIIEELCAVPITRQQKKNLEKKFGKEICPEALLTDNVIKVLRSAFSISSMSKTKNEEVEQKISVPATDKFPRTDLLLSAIQLIEEGYPLPFNNTELGNRYPDYVMTKDQYAEVTPSSPMWALDCEMCLTRAGNELTRVSVVDEQHKTVYESLCLPPNPIINYLTEYSGITSAMLKGVTTRLEDIQRDLRELFPPDVILVGQSLNGDLHALKMMHPYIIDTSVIFNLTGIRRFKSKLSKLAMEFLNETIQQRGAEGHDSVEDSLAALKLVQLKLTKSIEYGDAVLSGLNNMSGQDTNSSHANANYPEHHAGDFDDLQIEVGPMMATSLFKHVTMQKKTVAVIGPEETLAEYSTFVAAAHRENKQLVRKLMTDSSEQTVDLTCRESKNCNFTMAHIVLNDEEDIIQVDSWMKKIINSPPFNSLFIVILVGSHKNFANGACLVKVKKPNLRLKPRKTD